MVRDEGKPVDSLEWFTAAVQILTTVREKDPDSQDVRGRRYLCKTYENRAVAYERTRTYAAAAKDWDKVIELSPTSETSQPRIWRAYARLRAGMVAEALAEVDELTTPVADSLALPRWDALQLAQFACMYSIASQAISAQKQEHSDRAMELLNEAIRMGFNNVNQLQSDPSLDPLRGRDDFKKLLLDLEVGNVKETPFYRRGVKQ
jgi:tetratricopeptide (TPR) repeat protein